MNTLPFPALGAAALVAFAMSAVPSAAAVGEWVAGDHARVRLVAAGVDTAGNLSGGIEIEIDPDWHTYWRSPGDAGVPPVLDFAGSVNIDEPVVAYPAPARLDDGFSVSNVYTDYVLLPLTARADSASRPIDLVLKLDIGVCAEVCVPEHFEARLSVPATETDLAANKLIAAGRATVPGAPVAGVFSVESAARAGGIDNRPVFEIKARVPDAKSTTVFVEGPPDWYPAPAELAEESGGLAVYRVEFDRLTAKTPIPGAPLTVTLVSGGRAIEQTLTLD
ncbi:MAG: protein-disulfide reductase DsbD domain-containing protein [Bauldia sp.]